MAKKDDDKQADMAEAKDAPKAEAPEKPPVEEKASKAGKAADEKAPQHSAEDLKRCETCMLPQMNCRCPGRETTQAAPEPAETFEVGMPAAGDGAKKD